MADLRDAVKGAVIHRRVNQQGFVDDAWLKNVKKKLPPFPAKPGNRYANYFAIVDWDHHLPSRQVTLRLLGFYGKDRFSNTKSFVASMEGDIARQDKFPEFDTDDFRFVEGDETYRCELSTQGQVLECNLVSEWRNQLGVKNTDDAIGVVRDFCKQNPDDRELIHNHPLVGHLHAVSWIPPCESHLSFWSIDVWLTKEFDGEFLRGDRYYVNFGKNVVAKVEPFEVALGS